MRRKLGFLVLLAMVSVCHAQPGGSRPTQPNIVILFADDLGYGDLGSYGHPYIRTPNLDELAAGGQRWTDFYVAAAVCSPSRGALLTGKYPVRTGLYGDRVAVLFPDDTVGVPVAERTLAEALREAGYATTIIGKWHLGDAPDALPTRHGFDSWLGLPYSNDMDWVGEPGFVDTITMRAEGRGEELQAILAGRPEKYLNPRNEYWDVPLLGSRGVDGVFEDEIIERPARQGELTQRYTEQALEFIERNRARPFLLYVPYTMPHTPIFRSSAFVDRSLGGRYGDVVEELDWSVGRIVDRLEELGLAQNTLVLFTSDNGPWLTMNQHGGTAGLLRHGKSTTFEGGMRVPAIFWWPGRIEPAVVSDIGSTLDVYVTALALAGVEPTAETDGLDLTATLLDGAPSPRRTMAYYHGSELRAFRQDRYKLHFVTEGAYGQPPERTVHEQPLLYDLRDDPSEKFDISTQRPDVVADILEAVAAHRASLDVEPPLFDRRLGN